MLYHILSDCSKDILRINNIGFSSDINITHFGPTKRDIFLIFYVISGKGFYNGNPVSEGQGFLVYRGELEEYHADPDNPWTIMWITSDDNRVRPIFDSLNTDPKTQIFNFNFKEYLSNLASYIRLHHQMVIGSFEMSEKFFGILAHHEKEKSPPCKSSEDTYFDFAVKYVKTNLHTKVSVENLTEILGISQPYLYKIFKKRTSMSPKKFITEYKMINAKKLLCETSLSITQIATSLGFDDVLVFSNFFHKEEGVSPKKYREGLK